MKTIFLFCLSLLSLNIFAAEKFKYNLAPVAGTNEIIQFSHNDFYKVKLPGIMGLTPLSWMDEAWISYDAKKAIFIKNFFKVEGEVNYGKFYRSSHGVSLHERSGSETRLLYFHNFTQAEAKDLKRTLKKTAYNFSIISNAHASEEDCEENNFAQKMLTKLAPEDSLLHGILSSGGQCARGLIHGVWDATGGIVVDLGQGAYNLVTDPIATVDKIGQSFEAMKKFITNLREVMGETADAFDALPAAQQAKAVCHLIASAGTSIAVVVLSAGYAGPLALKALITSLQSINSSARSARLTKLISNLRTKEKLITEKLNWLEASSSGKALGAKLKEAQKLKQELADATDEMIDARYRAKPILKLIVLPGRKAAVVKAENKVYKLNKAYRGTLKDIEKMELDKKLATKEDLKLKAELAGYYGLVLTTNDDVTEKAL